MALPVSLNYGQSIILLGRGAVDTAEQPVISLDDRRPSQESSSGQPSYVARVGICMLNDQVVHDDRKDSLRKVIASLKADPRIKDLLDLDLKRVSLYRPKFATGGVDSIPDFFTGVPISPSVHLHALEIDPPLQFTVQIPRRLQVEEGLSERSAPSEEYLVVWDGIVLVVLWKLEGERPYGILGGAAVIRLLEEIAEKSGKSVYIQPCSPSCNYPFAHRDIQVISPGEQESPEQEACLKETDRWRVVLELGSKPRTPYDTASAVYSEVAFVSRWFARMRSDGKAMSEVERAARRDLRELLNIYHARTLVAPLSNPKSWKDRWKQRGWRSNSKRLVARLWLALSALESRRHDWANSMFAYDKTASRQGRGLIFHSEYEDQVNYVAAMDVSSIESSVEYAASHLDTRSVVVATAAGAIAGAIIGAMVAGIIQLANSPTTSSPNVTPTTSAHSAPRTPGH